MSSLFSFDGQPFVGRAPQAITARPRDLVTVRSMAGGTLREQSLLRPGWPARPSVTTYLVEWDHLDELQRARLDQFAQRPGGHTLSLWDSEVAVYAGDGVRTEFVLPWRHAPDVLTPPGNAPVTAFAVALGRLTADVFGLDAGLTVVEQSAVDYVAGSPPAGTAWRIDAGRLFKLASAPPVGDWVHVTAVPLRAVRINARGEVRQQPGVIRSPRRIELVEELVDP